MYRGKFISPPFFFPTLRGFDNPRRCQCLRPRGVFALSTFSFLRIIQERCSDKKRFAGLDLYLASPPPPPLGAATPNDFLSLFRFLVYWAISRPPPGEKHPRTGSETPCGPKIHAKGDSEYDKMQKNSEKVAFSHMKKSTLRDSLRIRMT